MTLSPDVAILEVLRGSDSKQSGMRIRVLFREVRKSINVDWLRFNHILLILQSKALVATVNDSFPVNKSVARLWAITDAGRQVLSTLSAKEAPKT